MATKNRPPFRKAIAAYSDGKGTGKLPMARFVARRKAARTKQAKRP